MNNIQLDQSEIDMILNPNRWLIKKDSESSRGHFAVLELHYRVNIYFLSNGKFLCSDFGEPKSNQKLKELGLNFSEIIVGENYNLYFHKNKENIIPFLNQCLNHSVFKKEDLNLLGDLNGKH